jgi:hypothetical protein
LKATGNHNYSIDLNPLLKDGGYVESYGTVEFESRFYQYVSGIELLINKTQTCAKESIIPNPVFNMDIVAYLDTRHSGKFLLRLGAIVKCVT